MVKGYDIDGYQLNALAEMETITLQKVMEEAKIAKLGKGLKRLAENIFNHNM